MLKIFYVFFIFLLISKPALAYLDPGSLTVIGTLFATGIAAIGGFFTSIKKRISKFLNINKKKNLDKDSSKNSTQ
tara:strand:- start:1412 stop:1636 length:225 start_codon:yes stop_codon:yes gene_type:complete